MKPEKDNLIEILEKIEPAKIENPQHKEKLKSVLINWKYKEQPTGVYVDFFANHKKMVFSLASVAAILLLFFATNIIFPPQLSLAQIQEIALNNPQVKEMISQGSKIEDVKIIEKRAYVLITKIETSMANKTSEKTGALAEISVREKKVTSIQQITLKENLLSDTEKQKIRELLEKSENKNLRTNIASEKIIIKEIIPQESELEIVPQNGTVRVLPKQERARIIYESQKEEKEAEVNITQEKVEYTKTIEQPPK